MNDPQDAVHALTRRAVDDLAQAWLFHSLTHPGESADVWFDELRRMIEARAGSLERVETMGPMGGGGADEA